jgi:hypothetical protein
MYFLWNRQSGSRAENPFGSGVRSSVASVFQPLHLQRRLRESSAHPPFVSLKGRPQRPIQMLWRVQFCLQTFEARQRCAISDRQGEGPAWLRSKRLNPRRYPALPLHGWTSLLRKSRGFFACAVLALMFLSCRSATAVNLAGAYSSQSDLNVNTTADSVPDGFTYWGNVGALSTGSAIYIGDDWMLTATHISGYSTGNTTLSFDDPVSGLPVSVQYKTVSDSFVHLTNTDPSATMPSDLVMYKIDPASGINTATQGSYPLDPNLSHVIIPTTAPVVTNEVLAIGRGIDRQDSKTFWIPSDTQPWTETQFSQTSGYKWVANNGQTMRWGENLVSMKSQLITVTGSTTSQVTAFATTFDKNGLPNEFQATTGDSGGGVFFQDPNSGRWELAGMMDATTSSTNQPSATSVFGNLTWIADLSQYRSQILSLAPMIGDVNGDTFIDGLDLSTVLGHWLLTGPVGDANGDGVVNGLDLSLVLGHWAPGPASPTPDQFGVTTTQTPEPSTLALAGMGLLCVWLRVGRSVVRN